MDISDDVKGEILLLTRYLLNFFRGLGFKRTADNFAKKANIDEEQPLDGSYMEFWELWLEGGTGMDYWTFFCHKKLKTLKEHTFQGKALTIKTPNQQPPSFDQSSLSQSYLSSARMHLSPQQDGQYNDNAMHSELGTSLDSGMSSESKRTLFLMLKKYIFDYFLIHGYKILGGRIVKESDIEEEQPYACPSGSTSSNCESIASRVKKRRRCSGEKSED